MSDSVAPYHEKQRLQLCAVHAINNLFQSSNTCSKEKLDNLCLQLDPSRWNNPHRSMLGMGNFDINVIMAFLQTLNYDVLWFDKRKCVTTIEVDSVFGFLINRPSPLKLFGVNVTMNLLTSKHWYAVRKLNNDNFYNLDSKLPRPHRIGGRDELMRHLENKLKDGQGELLLIVTSGVTQQEIVKDGTN